MLRRRYFYLDTDSIARAGVLFLAKLNQAIMDKLEVFSRELFQKREDSCATVSFRREDLSIAP